MGILLTIVLAILTIVLIFALRYKCKSNRTWVSGSKSVKLAETEVPIDWLVDQKKNDSPNYFDNQSITWAIFQAKIFKL